MSPATRHLTLIGGAQRSGTTLAQTVICNALPGPAAVLAENGLLRDLFLAYKHAAQKWNKTSGFYETREELKAFIATTVENHVGDVARKLGEPSHIVIKQPFFAGLMPEIAEVLPKATLILCVRDPRDIVASFVKIGSRDAEVGKTNHFAQRYIIGYCNRVNAAYAAANSAQGRVHEIRYEQLVSDAPGALADLAKRTGLPLSVPKLDEMKWLASENRHQQNWVTPLEERAPSDESVGNYKTLLSTGEIALVENLCGETMRRLGYAPVTRASSRWRGSLAWLNCALRKGVVEIKKM